MVAVEQESNIDSAPPGTHPKSSNLAVDMVALVTGLVPRSDASQVAQTFHITHDKDGFFLEAHPKLRPFSINTEDIFLAGTCHGPKDIADSIAHANAAAAEALALLGRGRVTIEPIVAEINPCLCTGCKICLGLCPYLALTFDAEKDVVEVNSALCRGCGTCVATCPSDPGTARHFTEQQIFAHIEALLVQQEQPLRLPLPAVMSIRRGVALRLPSDGEAQGARYQDSVRAQDHRLSPQLVCLQRRRPARREEDASRAECRHHPGDVLVPD